MSVASSIGSPFYPPIGVQDLNSVLIQGNQANNQDIIGVRDIDCVILACDNIVCTNNVTLSTINNLPYPPAGSNETLNQVLLNGNNAGGQSITNLTNVNLSTINNLAYPPEGSNETLSEVLTNGNNAGGQSILGVGNIDVLTINGAVYPPLVPSAGTLEQVLTNGNDANGFSIVGVNNIDVTTINGAVYPPVVPSAGTLEQVLTNGNDANGKSIVGVDNIASGMIQTADLEIYDIFTINGRVYPTVGNPKPVYPALGSIKVNQFLASPPLLSGINYTSPFGYIKGIYTGKVEVDFFVQNAGNAIALVEVFYGSVTGTNIGYSSTLIQGGTLFTVSVPFLVNILNDNDLITIKMTCTYTQGGNWNTTNQSDIDVLRIF